MNDQMWKDLSEIWKLPCMSQEFESGPVLELQRGTLVLRYDFETVTGDYKWEAATFRSVMAVLFTDHESCSEEQVAAYDRLVEVGCSSWLKGLQSARIYPASGIRHLRIYFDELGCYDVAASDFDPPPVRMSSDEADRF